MDTSTGLPGATATGAAIDKLRNRSFQNNTSCGYQKYNIIPILESSLQIKEESIYENLPQLKRSQFINICNVHHKKNHHQHSVESQMRRKLETEVQEIVLNATFIL